MKATEKVLLRIRLFLFILVTVFAIASNVTAGNETYSYDNAGRLIMADYGNGNTITYTYDAAGNILTTTSSIPVDNDGDGYTGFDGDCNDDDNSIYPGACDIKSDGIDQNCDGVDRTKGKPCPGSGGGGGNKEICDDGIDNDGDGKIDCADKKDCGKDPACTGGGTQEICDDGIDNDGDGKIDCADKKDCGKAPACTNN